jgi:adenosylmethionine-8-amino-7-oxononanoate aminotransferase
LTAILTNEDYAAATKNPVSISIRSLLMPFTANRHQGNLAFSSGRGMHYVADDAQILTPSPLWCVNAGHG